MIAISVQFNAPFRPVADLTIPIMEEYAKIHSYELIIGENLPIKRSIVWDRYSIIQENLPEYDAIVHMDCDVMITNMNIRLEEFTGLGYIVISRAVTEQGISRFNDGVVFLKNKPETFRVLDSIMATPDDDFVKCGQDAMERLYCQGKIPSPYFERQKAINAFDYTQYSMPETTVGQWTEGDWLIHYPGCNNETRVREITEKLPIIIR
jgi:hypothetical protein